MVVKHPLLCLATMQATANSWCFGGGVAIKGVKRGLLFKVDPVYLHTPSAHIVTKGTYLETFTQ